MSEGSQIGSTAEELLEEARTITGIRIVDTEAREPLTVLLDSYNRSAKFTPDGAVVKRSYLMRILRNRLCMLRDFAAHPEIHEIELRPPVIINALARTGSTKLQKTLAATGDFNWLPYWMVLNSASETGEPNEDTSSRIADVQAYADWFDTAAPDVKFGHPMLPFEPEEEAYIMNQSLLASSLTGFAQAPEYTEWLATQDEGHQFLYVRDTLKYLIWQGLADANKPFLLKCVKTVGLEEHMRRAYPLAHIVATHRNPVSVVPSASKLGLLFRGAFSNQELDMGSRPVRMAAAMNASLDYRAGHPEERWLDINYERIRTETRTVIEEIYAFAGLQPTAETFTNVEQWETANPQNKHGRWDYAAADFGFTDADTREAFARYIQWVETKGICAWD